MRDLNLTIVGNLTGDPELRFTPTGIAVAAFTVAHTPRTFDKTADAWKDGEPTFLDCRAWRQLAENIVESLRKGARVIVAGTLETQRWEKDGEKRSRIMMTVIGIGPELSYATASVKKMTRNGGPADDPWATAGTARPAGDAPAFDSEPPF